MLALGTVQPDTYKTFTFTLHLAHPPDKMWYLFIQGGFFNWPPKKLKYVKPRLGVSTLT